MGRVVVDEDQSANLQSESHLDETISYNDFENPNICPTIEFDRPTVRLQINDNKLCQKFTCIANPKQPYYTHISHYVLLLR